MCGSVVDINLQRLRLGEERNQKAPQGGCGHRRQHARLR